MYYDGKTYSKRTFRKNWWYKLVVVTSKRARQLSEGALPLTDKEEESMVTLAAQEIAEGKVVIEEDVEDE